MFDTINKQYVNIQGSSLIKAEQFEEKVKKIFSLWSEWSIYDLNFMNGLQATFYQDPNKFITSAQGVQVYKYD